MAAAAYQRALILMKEEKYAEANDILADLASRGNVKATIDLANSHFYGLGVEKDRLIAYDILNNANERSPDIDLIEHLCTLRLKDLDRVNHELNEKERNDFYESMYDNFTYASFYESKNPLVYLCLGNLYETGTGTAVNLFNAQENYFKSYDLSIKNKKACYEAVFRFARLQLNFENTLKDGVKNMIYCAQNYLPAKVYAGRLYYEGKLINKDYSKAYDLFNEAAKSGIYEAQFYLAEMLETGVPEVCEQDIEKAVSFYFSVAMSLSGRKGCILESLPPLATSPEYCIPIDKRAIEKLELYNPDLISIVDKCKKIDSNNKCSRYFFGGNYSNQHLLEPTNIPGVIGSLCLCLHCAKSCSDGVYLVDRGISTLFCDCKCFKGKLDYK